MRHPCWRRKRSIRMVIEGEEMGTEGKKEEKKEEEQGIWRRVVYLGRRRWVTLLLGEGI